MPPLRGWEFISMLHSEHDYRITGLPGLSTPFLKSESPSFCPSWNLFNRVQKKVGSEGARMLTVWIAKTWIINSTITPEGWKDYSLMKSIKEPNLGGVIWLTHPLGQKFLNVLGTIISSCWFSFILMGYNFKPTKNGEEPLF